MHHGKSPEGFKSEGDRIRFVGHLSCTVRPGSGKEGKCWKEAAHTKALGEVAHSSEARLFLETRYRAPGGVERGEAAETAQAQPEMILTCHAGVITRHAKNSDFILKAAAVTGRLETEMT
jgi:hypothetical protein